MFWNILQHMSTLLRIFFDDDDGYKIPYTKFNHENGTMVYHHNT
jgi:hypothetical protein